MKSQNIKPKQTKNPKQTKMTTLTDEELRNVIKEKNIDTLKLTTPAEMVEVLSYLSRNPENKDGVAQLIQEIEHRH